MDTVTTGRCLCGACEWEYRGAIPDATICNCNACRRYGVLWAYDYEDHAIHVRDAEGQIVPYQRARDGHLTFNFCKTCGNIVSWRGRKAGDDGRVRIAVNLRLAVDPEAVAAIPLLRFDGLHTFEDLPPDGRTVKDMWF